MTSAPTQRRGWARRWRPATAGWPSTRPATAWPPRPARPGLHAGVVPGPARLLPAPAGGRPMLLAAVPLSVVRGPDGAFYVGELTSFPHPPGRVRVWRVVPGRDPVVYATGLTAVTGLSWGPGDRLHVHQAGSGPVRVSG